MDEERRELIGMDCYICQESEAIIQVKRGSIELYIVQMEIDNQSGKRVRVAQIQSVDEIHDTFPAFAFQDESGRQWRFLMTSASGSEAAEIVVRRISSTDVVKKRFLEYAGINTYEQEGFEYSLIEFYNRRELKDTVYIGIQGNNIERIQIKTVETIGGAVHGNDTEVFGDDDFLTALSFGCKKAGIKLADQLDSASLAEKNSIQEIARIGKFICREIELDNYWWKSDCGILLTQYEGAWSVCFPTTHGKYKIFHGSTKQERLLSKDTIAKVNTKAWLIERSLPEKQLSKRDIIQFAKKSVRKEDLVFLIVLGLICALIGILQPKLNQLIFDEYIPLGDTNTLVEICLLIASFMVGNVFISIVKNLQEYRLPCRIGYQLQDAVYWRLFSLRESFYREYDSADLAERIASVGQIANTLASKVFTEGLGAVLGIVYLVQMFRYSWKLALISLIMLLVHCTITFFITKGTLKNAGVMAKYRGNATGKLYQLIGGVDKIRMAGIEERAVLEYMQPVANEKQIGIRIGRLNSLGAIINDAGPTIFSMVLYYVVVKQSLGLTTGAFLAFNSAFGAFTGVMIGIVKAVEQCLQLKPAINRVKPILEIATENDEGKDEIAELKGDIQLEHVTFGYSADQTVLKDISFHVFQGDYVAIVGPSGSGKSTILKLLLGFEAPRSGKVLYDGKDIATINKHDLRRKMGVVLQDGKLISGSIYDNITIANSNPDMKDVLEVIEDVGLKEDIDAMPMGIHTMMSEGGGTVSGGQRQRILIARAIFNKPSVLYFDEATSALDNITQAKVCAGLEKRNMTRVVIAHRLSTVQNCDRIIVIDKGQIVEMGTYAELMQREGLFYKMAIRQIAE